MNAPDSPAKAELPILRPVPPVLTTPVGPASPLVEAPAVSPTHRWRWGVHLLLMAAYPVVLGLSAWRGHQGRDSGPALSHGTRGLLVVSAWELAIFGVVCGLAWVASRASRDDLLLRWRQGWVTVPLGAAYSLALRLGVLVIAVVVATVAIATQITSLDALQRFVLTNRPKVEAVVDLPAMRHNPAYYWLTITLVSFVLAGLREELWRSACIAGLKNLSPRWFGSRGGQLAAAAAAAIFFGFGHLPQGILMVGMTAFLGLGLGAIMVLHRSIWPAVLAHGFFDAATLAVIPFVIDKLPALH